MADEVLLALPEVDCLDYTMKEYMRMTEHVNTCVERLNSKEGGGRHYAAAVGEHNCEMYPSS